MKGLWDYFDGWPEYIGRIFYRIDLICGGVVAILFFALAGQLRLEDHQNAVVAFIVIGSFVESGYKVYREERTARSERERDVQIKARIIRFAANDPYPGPDKTSIGIGIDCEVWTRIDLTTDVLGLNVIWGYRNHWWELWKKSRVVKEGLPPVGTDTTQFRKSVSASHLQPTHWQFDFYYVTERSVAGDPHWFLELVIKMGMPSVTYRIPVSLENSFGSRVTHPPL